MTGLEFLRRAQRPVGMDHQLARNRDQICVTSLQNGLGVTRLGDEANGDRLDAGLTAHTRGLLVPAKSAAEEL